MSWRDKSDLGTTLVANVKELLRISDDWLIDRNGGFTWWASDYAQSIWSDLGLFHNGVTIYRLHCETEMLRGKAQSQECEQVLSKMMSSATLSGLTYDEATDQYRLHCSVFAHDDNKEWLKRVFLGAAALQVIDAQSNEQLSNAAHLEPALSSHPTHGRRLEHDPILTSGEKLFKPYGAQPTKWQGIDEWDEAKSRVRRMAQHSVTDGQSYLEAEFDWHVAGDMPPMRMEMRCDRPHPVLGNGLDMRLTLPIEVDSAQRPHFAMELNARERKEWNWSHDLGSWCTVGREVQFRCFLPNICFAPGALPDLAHELAIRANWVNDELSRAPIGV